MMRLQPSRMFRYHPVNSLTLQRRQRLTMSKTEILLILLVLVILCFSIWFILSDQIWALVSYLETLLYPDIVTPE
ncbi:hypothetical protein SAMN02744775_03061 [Enterobacter sp. CC120223-11]|nr:hypothetical protein SAMN02744775_03061 [Enterobacter sp. CC120223-11]